MVWGYRCLMRFGVYDFYVLGFRGETLPLRLKSCGFFYKVKPYQ